MEFMYCSFPASMMVLDHQLHHRSEPSFEDDLYYAELERQILLLTADDEDVSDHKDRHGPVLGGKTPLSLSPTRHASSARTAMAAVGADFVRWGNYGNHRGTEPWQKSKGTGVFIPQTIKSQTSRKFSGRMYSGRRMKRQIEYMNHDAVRSVFGFR